MQPGNAGLGTNSLKFPSVVPIYLKGSYFENHHKVRTQYINKNHQKINANKTPRNIISRALQHNRYLTTVLKKVIPKKLVGFFEFLLYKKAERVALKESEKSLLEQYINEDYLKFKKDICHE